jgi:hypothetical protein
MEYLPSIFDIHYSIFAFKEFSLSIKLAALAVLKPGMELFIPTAVVDAMQGGPLRGAAKTGARRYGSARSPTLHLRKLFFSIRLEVAQPAAGLKPETHSTVDFDRPGV